MVAYPLAYKAMNRPIKFRAWDKEQKCMWYGGYVVFGMPLQTDITDLHQTKVGKYPRKESVLMQYTGLHDKNGKEIYEGDIVKIYYGPDRKLADTFDVYLAPEYAAFVRRNLFAEVLGGERHYSIEEGFMHEHHMYEVIGNIYENKELLP